MSGVMPDDPDRVARVRDLAAAGIGRPEIARRIGLTSPQVGNLARRNGIKLVPDQKTTAHRSAVMQKNGRGAELGRIAAHVKRMRAARPMTEAEQQAAIAAFLAQRGATVCPTVACIPINANEGFRR
jgi:hypothetical protein